MLIMRGIQGAELQLKLVSGGAGDDPAVGTLLVKHIGHGRQIDEMDAGGLVLLVLPGVGVTVDECLHLFMPGQHRKHGITIG